MNAFTRMNSANWDCALIVVTLAAIGCRSTTYSQRGTTSAPSAAASPAAAIGTSLEDIDARNRANIAAQLGRPVAPGPATPAEVAAMTHAGVEPRFIIGYINRSTSLNPITAQDVIYLHEQGVNEQVIQAMLTPGSAYSRTEVARAMPQQVLIIEDPWAGYGYPYYYGYAYGCGCRCY